MMKADQVNILRQHQVNTLQANTLRVNTLHHRDHHQDNLTDNHPTAAAHRQDLHTAHPIDRQHQPQDEEADKDSNAHTVEDPWTQAPEFAQDAAKE